MPEQNLLQPASAAPEGRAARFQARLAQSTFVQRPLAFYERHERYAPALFFFAGVAWDAGTLQRIDAWFDNLFLLAYLLLLGGLIIVAARVECGQIRHRLLQKYREWFPAAIQFFLGALFSAYVIYYSQSASFTRTALFLVLLVGLLVANEFIHRRLVNLHLLFALYFLATFSFFTFFIPVITKQMSYATFLVGGVLSVGVVGGMVWYLWRRAVFSNVRQFAGMLGIVLGLFGLLNLFYVQNWIPPVPLAMRHGNVYHHVQRQGSVYTLTFEAPQWYEFWRNSDQHFNYASGDTVYCFTAIFAPTQLVKGIYHEWQYFDEAQAAWTTTDHISYEVVGGRDGGYRGYTMKRHVRPGRWRVDVETAEGQILGRIPFVIHPTEVPVAKFRQIQYE